MKRFMLVSLMSCVLVSGHLFASSSGSNSWSDLMSGYFKKSKATISGWLKKPETKLFGVGVVAPLLGCGIDYGMKYNGWISQFHNLSIKAVTQGVENASSSIKNMNKAYENAPKFFNVTKAWTKAPLFIGAVGGVLHCAVESGIGIKEEAKEGLPWYDLNKYVSNTSKTALRRSASFVAGLGIAAVVQSAMSK